MTDPQASLIFGPLVFAVLITSWVVTYRLAGGKNVLVAIVDLRFTRPKIIASLVSVAISFIVSRLLGFGPN
jgi:ABC-type sulfate transport system permease subunit